MLSYSLTISKECSYRTVAVVHFTDQNWIPKTVYCIRFAMVCKISLTNWNAKIALLRASMVVIYYIKLFRTGADRQRYFNVSTPSSRRDKRYEIVESDISTVQILNTFPILKLQNLLNCHPFLYNINDPAVKSIVKYRIHPSILKIREVCNRQQESFFTFSHVDKDQKKF